MKEYHSLGNETSKKIKLTEKEKIMFETIEETVKGTLSKKDASERLNVTTRTINRALNVYFNEGMFGFMHGLKGRTPVNALDKNLWEVIIDSYETRFNGYNFSHFRDKWIEEGGEPLSYGTFYNILTSAGFISPKARKRKNKKQHPLRARKEKFGELVQMDASEHLWFGTKKCHLHIAIDDATSKIIGAFFDYQETLNGYYNVFKQILTSYGVPKTFYTDRRTIFTYKRKGEEKLENNTFTQFALAAKNLGVNNIKTTSCPQAKGRVERSFNTHQDRLINELKSANIKNINDANIFLIDYIKRHNKKFALTSKKLESAFLPKPSNNEINLYLSIISVRHINQGCTVKYMNKYYLPFSDKKNIYLKKGTEVFVIKTMNNHLYMGCDEFIWPLVDYDDKLKNYGVKLLKKIPQNTIFQERRIKHMIKFYEKVA